MYKVNIELYNMDKKIQKKKINGLMTDKNITEEENKKLEEFSKLTQIIKLRNDDNDPVKIIIDKKNKNNELNVTEKNDNFQEYIDELKDLTSKIDDETRDFMKKSNFAINNIEMLFLAFSSDKKFEEIQITDELIKNIFEIFKKDNKIKYKNINYYNPINTAYSDSKKYYENRYKLNLLSLLLIYKNLEQGGNIIMSLQWLISKFVNIVYLSTLLFEEVYIIGKGVVICKNFKNDIKYINILFDIIKKNYNFSVENKINEKEIIFYLKQSFFYDLYFKKKLIIDKKKQLYLSFTYIQDIKFLKKFSIDKIELENMILNLKKTYQKLIKPFNFDNKKNKNKNKNVLIKDIFNKDYELILNIIKKYDLKRCLEVGFVYNFLTNIINDKKDVFLTSINTLKNNKLNTPLKNLNDKRFKLLNDSVLNVYNKLYENHEKFDFILINDKYNFDFILFYFIYSDKILNKDGFIVINNSHLNPVSYCIKYIELNFPSYKKIGLHPTITFLKKVSDVEKDPYFFIPF